MIPRFPPTPSARECALSTSPGTCGCRRSLPETAWPDSSDPSPENHPTGGLAHLKHATCPRCFDTPQPRTGSTTDLDTECDRSRAGSGPISTRVTTDLAPEPDRSRRDLARGAECGRTPASRLTRLTFSNEIDGGTVDLVRKSRPRRLRQSRRRCAGWALWALGAPALDMYMRINIM